MNRESCEEKCKICNSELDRHGIGCILNKYDVAFYRCPKCGFIQTESPYWLNEAYASAITDTDIGLLQRNIQFSSIVSAILKFQFPDFNGGLDWGGGYGIFVRLMRDRGFDFQWYDKYCDNMFAKSHERKMGKYDIITAFEFFEHVEDPKKELNDILSYGDTVLFSTEILPEPAPQLGEWWYYGLEHGQHISFYTEKALSLLAAEHNSWYYRCNNLHIITNKTINLKKVNICINHSYFVNRLWKKKSLLQADYDQIKSSFSERN